jgi:hypothetical protein
MPLDNPADPNEIRTLRWNIVHFAMPTIADPASAIPKQTSSVATGAVRRLRSRTAITIPIRRIMIATGNSVAK